MNTVTATKMETTAARATQLKARIAGTFYLLTFVLGAVALVMGSGMPVANIIATFPYIGVTVLFYWLFKPVSKTLS